MIIEVMFRDAIRQGTEGVKLRLLFMEEIQIVCRSYG